MDISKFRIRDQFIIYKPLPRDITHDPRALFTTGNPALTRNPDGSWKVSSTEIRFNVYTSSGYHHELISTLDQQQLAPKAICNRPTTGKM
jgi:hypothetical protein